MPSKKRLSSRARSLPSPTSDPPANERGETAHLSPHDHRRIGAELELFLIDPLVGSGLPLWLPNGTALRHQLETYVMEEESAAGYQRVATPHLGREELYVTSGHLPYYQGSMFPVMTVDNERFVVKPMNCPHHIRIYQSRPRSYRELPFRLAEFGTVYRYEKSGQLQGLTRVRGMTMNDAHIFCSKDHLKQEVLAVLDLTRRIYRTLGLQDFHVDLALHDPKKKGKYADRPALWIESEASLRSALTAAKVTFSEAIGDAAFYGPKADIQMEDVAGHTFTVSTIQLDILLPGRFGITYTNAQGKPEQPILIHRAPIGTSERFVAFLIEHFGGAFPFWLAPIQVRVLPLSREFHRYAEEVSASLRTAGFRVERDDSNETLPKKIRSAETAKIPVMGIVGKKEAASRTIALRAHGGKDLGENPLPQALEFLRERVRARTLSF